MKMSCKSLSENVREQKANKKKEFIAKDKK